MPPSGRRATIIEVAQAAGVSTTTVSVVLNERPSTVRISDATRATVKQAAVQLGYIPNSAAQSLRRQRPTILTLLVGSLANPFFTDLAAGVRTTVAERGYELNVVDADLAEAEEQALDQLRNGSSAGVIVATGRHGERGAAIAALQGLVQRGLPAVIMSDRSPDPAIPAIRIDDEQGAFVATQHLLQLGHRRIAHLTSRSEPALADPPSVEADRFQGYQRALAAAGVVLDPAWVISGPPTLTGGAALIHALLARPGQRPTAVFCISDLLAIGALRGLYEARVRVPEDMAVVGFDGIVFGQFTTPALTSMEQPRQEMGRRAAEVLLAQLDGGEVVPGEQVLPATLLIRESCGAALFGDRSTGAAEYNGV